MVACMADVRWISCDMFTCEYTVDAVGVIIKAAPIIKKFLGQHEDNLIKWASDNSKSFVFKVRHALPETDTTVYYFTDPYNV
jgi:hypothetical protein